MSGALEIRPCRLEECARVLELWRQAEALESVTDSPDVLEQLVREHGGRFLIAVRGGRVVGSVIAGWDGWRGHVYRLAVVPAERRRGLARRLVEEAERQLVALGARRLSITVDGGDPLASDFWEAMQESGWGRDRRAIRFVKTLV